MAKIFFVGLDGAEKSYRLQTHRPFTLGRDPGNDIILRDPKVSRHHAEIVFERGFFVLHDLASANGTYVNGKRIRVAPLTHGARLRMGNTYGRFSRSCRRKRMQRRCRRHRTARRAVRSARASDRRSRGDDIHPPPP
jgi:pSer/pThr/pTyr-binding forkhead associated (FHA) protein